MLDGTSSIWAHRLQNAGLIVLSLFFLPLGTLVLVSSYYPTFVRSRRQRETHELPPDFTPKTILVTGVGMTKGLALARLFHESGHTVIGAEFEANRTLVCGRVSKALQTFYPLSQSSQKEGSAKYIQDLLDIILHEHVDLWVSCSGVASAVDDGEAKEVVESRTKCKAIQFDVKTTQMLHEKDSFIAHTESLGLIVPETHYVTSHRAIEKILEHATGGQKYILKFVGVDDATRADMTLLPRPTVGQTSKHISKLDISQDRPWVLQRYILGPEFCTHSLVVRGEVRAFVACPSAELLMHYEALLPDSALSQAMLEFTRTFSSRAGRSFTGHLSFDFLIDHSSTESERGIVLYPIECNPRTHTAVALFNGTPRLVDAYLSVLEEDQRGDLVDELVVPIRQDKYYWIGHDLVQFGLLPILSLLTLRGSMAETLQSLKILAQHILCWKDGTYEVWDPLPWWWLYHIYWPMRFWNSIVSGTKWSRINVSTTKMFEC